MKKDVIALVGAGSGGKAILETLVKMEGFEIRYVYDINPDAPGMIFAREHGIASLTDDSYSALVSDHGVDLVFEVTGNIDVYRALRTAVMPKGIVIGSAGTKIIFHLLEDQQNITRRLEALTEVLEHKVAERTEDLEAANKQLHANNEALKKVIEDKVKYLLQATHQLKAPFAAIQSYVDVIANGYAGETTSETNAILQKIKRRCDMLSGSIKEMLELARLQTCGMDNAAMEDVNINDALGDTISQFESVAENRKIGITFKPFETDMPVKCSAVQLKTLFSIVLDNAINYSDDGSKIEVMATVREDRPVVSIKDQGIGIPTEKQDKIFDEFFRTNDGVEKHTNGSGLGLSIAREIAKLNGFHLGIDSQVGEGTEFIVTMR